MWRILQTVMAKLFRKLATLRPQNIGLKAAWAKRPYIAHGCPSSWFTYFQLSSLIINKVSEIYDILKLLCYLNCSSRVIQYHVNNMNLELSCHQWCCWHDARILTKHKISIKTWFHSSLLILITAFLYTKVGITKEWNLTIFWCLFIIFQSLIFTNAWGLIRILNINWRKHFHFAGSCYIFF